MTIITGAAVLLAQADQYTVIASQIMGLASQINTISQQENPQADIGDRIRALGASLTVQLEGTRSQVILVQQALDNLMSIIS